MRQSSSCSGKGNLETRKTPPGSRAALALTEWEALAAPYEVATTRMLLGVACRDAGDEEAADTCLARAAADFRHLGVDIHRLHVTGRARLPGGLTEREARRSTSGRTYVSDAVAGSTSSRSASRSAISVVCNPCSNGKPMPRPVARQSAPDQRPDEQTCGQAIFRVTRRHRPTPAKAGCTPSARVSVPAGQSLFLGWPSGRLQPNCNPTSPDASGHGRTLVDAVLVAAADRRDPDFGTYLLRGSDIGGQSSRYAGCVCGT